LDRAATVERLRWFTYGGDGWVGSSAVKDRLGKAWGAWLPLALTPGLMIVIGLCVYPLLLASSASLSVPGGFFVGRYVEFFTGSETLNALVRTVSLAIATMLVSVAISVPLGYVARNGTFIGTLVRLLVALPLAVPVLIAGYALTLFFSLNGLFNNILVHVLSVLSEPITLSYTWGGLVIACVWRFFPYTALLVITAIGSMNRQVEDAAAIAGATPWQTFWRITLPVIAPAALTGGVLTFVNTFGTFSIPLVMGGGSSGEVLSVMAYREIAGRFNWPAASTIVLVMALIQVATLIVLRYAVARWTNRVESDLR
jgi:ABC-type spermidine/putrescine transport system permease subunit I